MKLTDEEINKLKLGKSFWLEGISYYCKIAFEDGIEIIISELAALVKINCPKYILIDAPKQSSKFTEKYYLSKDINMQGLFLTATEMGLHSNSLYDIWMFLEKNFHSDIAKTMYKIVKIYFFDILMLNYDRTGNNWGFLLKNDGQIKDIYIIDNEESFDASNSVSLSAKLNRSDSLKSYTHQAENLFFSISENMQELEYFLSTSSSEYIELFLQMYEALTPEVVKNVFLQKEEEGLVIENKDDYLKIYQMNYEAIGQIIKGRGLKRWKKNT